jgi:stage II sporulation protein AA (anti-sigma F factor antagonist)
MRILVKRQDDYVTAFLYGELDHHSADEFKQQLDDIIGENRELNLVLDLKNLSFMDSSGLGVLLGRYKKLKSAGSRMYLKNPNSQIEKVFNVSGIYNIIKKIK